MVGGLPFLALAFALATGRADALLSSGPVGMGAMLTGLALETIGLAAVIIMSREAAS